MVSMPIAASAKGTPSSKHVSEYAQLGIIKKDDAFFYKNKRICSGQAFLESFRS